jgi:hypothetical protein
MNQKTARSTERGSARLKFILVILVIATVAYIGYLYIPVAYQSYLFKDLMQHNADVASAMGHDPAWVKNQLTKAAPEYDIPSDAIILPERKDNRMEVTVQFTKPIAFPGYTYNYTFDHTVKSSAFLTLK